MICPHAIVTGAESASAMSHGKQNVLKRRQPGTTNRRRLTSAAIQNRIHIPISFDLVSDLAEV
jgi:hypothetical protein